MTILQYSFKYDEIPDAAPIVDCRVIDNPYRKFKHEEDRYQAVRRSPKFESLVIKGVKLLQLTDIIVVACAYGKHRSGAVAEEIAKRTGATIVKGVNK